VQARLDRALTRASTSSPDVVPNLAEHRRRRFSRPTMAGSAAAAVIVLAFGAIIIGHLGNGSSSGGSEAGGTTASTPGSERSALAQPKDYVRTSSGVTYTPSNLATLIPGLVAGAQFRPQTSTSVPPEPAASGTAATTHPQNLSDQPVPAVLRPLFDSRARILHCAAALTGIPNAVPIAVDFGRWTNGQYKKAPSAILVMRDPDPNKVDVWVTNPSCSGNLVVRIRDEVPLN
jgi:hypothetical protein